MSFLRCVLKTYLFQDIFVTLLKTYLHTLALCKPHFIPTEPYENLN